MANKPGESIRLGVVGVWRGRSFVEMAKANGMEIVALCDTWEEKLRAVGQEMGVKTYTQYDQFLEHPMDGVVLANYFHEHAPFAIKALDAGKHVLSETSACKTLGEGVALVEAVERNNQVYMLAENYPFFLCNQEMKALYNRGEIGEMQFGEGEYIHPMSADGLNGLAPRMDHWRNQIPASYYCTHALAPLMHITGTRPTSVNSLYIPWFQSDKERLHVRRNDPASVIMCRMDNEAVITLNGVILRGESCWWRLHGVRGYMENMRTGDTQMVRILHDSWDRKEHEKSEMIYKPQFSIHKELAEKAGHGGGDFFTSYHFARAIRGESPPMFDVYAALDMTLVGIQAYRSALEEGAPKPVPDFRDPTVRNKYKDDDWSPYDQDRKPGQPFPSYKGEVIPTKEQIASAEKVWDKLLG
jgi:predicted dehydrogenase